MESIVIAKGRRIIAHHTTDHPRSSYGQNVWVVEEENPGGGKILWKQGDNEMELKAIGVVGGWLVAQQSDGALCGIIWSDGRYYAELIVDRETEQPVKQTTLPQLQSGKYMVRGTITVGAFDRDSPLGCIL